MAKFLLVWSSGHNPAKPVYYQKLKGRGWNGTYDRGEAFRFRSVRAALDRYLSLHAVPEDYEPYIRTGEVRAERDGQMSICF